ncbi:MAG TPA: acyloxyacyl hydrolase [Burkholderiales bacterium]|nr:acyloxyacyl hydrolase [Burkholderiales bacterium]
MKKFPAALAPLLLLGAALPAQALDGAAFEFGYGDREASLVRVAGQWHQPHRWLPERIQLHWDLSFARWDSDTNPIYDVGFTPVFRYSRAARGPYLEAAIGLHWLSSTSVHREAPFSTRFQFGDHVGIGYRFRKFDMGVRLQHLSNGGIRNPNPGINFLIFRIGREVE